MKRFRGLVPGIADEEILSKRLPFQTIVELPELRFNPFRDRLVSVFSSEEDGCLSFEDFLDLVSVLNENAPLQLKADWAFRVFGNYMWHVTISEPQNPSIHEFYVV